MRSLLVRLAPEPIVERWVGRSRGSEVTLNSGRALDSITRGSVHTKLRLMLTPEDVPA
jgi:hypothetical protein